MGRDLECHFLYNPFLIYGFALWGKFFLISSLLFCLQASIPHIDSKFFSWTTLNSLFYLFFVKTYHIHYFQYRFVCYIGFKNDIQKSNFGKFLSANKIENHKNKNSCFFFFFHLKSKFFFICRVVFVCN